jgi:glycosidase
MEDMGYDVRDHKKILDVYGTMDDWRRLLDELHKKRIRSIMDIVLNHTSNQVKF